MRNCGNASRCVQVAPLFVVLSNPPPSAVAMAVDVPPGAMSTAVERPPYFSAGVKAYGSTVAFDAPTTTRAAAKGRQRATQEPSRRYETGLADILLPRVTWDLRRPQGGDDKP